MILGGVPDEALGLREGHIAGRRAVPLIVGDNLDLAVLEDSDAGVGRAKIDTNRGCLRHFFFPSISARHEDRDFREVKPREASSDAREKENNQTGKREIHNTSQELSALR